MNLVATSMQRRQHSMPEGHQAAAVVYARRQHVINVYSWPSREPDSGPKDMSPVNGYHLVVWRRDGIEQWAVSDLNNSELQEFVHLVQNLR